MDRVEKLEARVAELEKLVRNLQQWIKDRLSGEAERQKLAEKRRAAWAKKPLTVRKEPCIHRGQKVGETMAPT